MPVPPPETISQPNPAAASLARSCWTWWAAWPDEGGAHLTAVPVHRVALVGLQAAEAEPVVPGDLLGERDQAGVAERQPAPPGADVQLDQHPDRHAVPAGHRRPAGRPGLRRRRPRSGGRWRPPRRARRAPPRRPPDSRSGCRETRRGPGPEPPTRSGTRRRRSCPAASCCRISVVHLCALKCGRRAARWPAKKAAHRWMLRLAAAASTTRQGVGRWSSTDGGRSIIPTPASGRAPAPGRSRPATGSRLTASIDRRGHVVIRRVQQVAAGHQAVHVRQPQGRLPAGEYLVEAIGGCSRRGAGRAT